MVVPVFLQIVSPLNTGLSNKNGKFLDTSFNARVVFSKPREQTALYVGENFALQMTHSHFRLANLIHNLDVSGFVTSSFLPTKMLEGMALSAGGQRLLTVPNAGGSSVVSEVLSFELLTRCFNAQLTKTEMEVQYFPYGGSITDYVCKMFQMTVGVSVTRAMKFAGDYCLEDAHRLLNKKLKGVNQATNNTLESWDKQILHVWSTSHHVTHQLALAYADLETKIKANTVVMVTTAAGADFIFNNG